MVTHLNANSTAESDWGKIAAKLVLKLINYEWSCPLFHVGESVLVKAGQVPKGSSLYHGPYKVIEVLSIYSFQLSDGQKWSMHAMKWWVYPPNKDEDPFIEGNHEGEVLVNEGTHASQTRPEDRPGANLSPYK